MTTKTNVRILNLEDNIHDSELIQARLEAGGVPSEITRVDSEERYQDALNEGGFDVIICDFCLPSYDGHRALKLARQCCPEIPFIFFSGVLGEELAVQSLKDGASDYVLKHRPARLASAVLRALDDARELADLKRAEESLRSVQNVVQDYAKKLERADHAKDQFLAMLGHELRNPLGAASNALHIVQKHAKTAPPLQRAADVLERQLAQITRLVDELLDLSRITHGKIKIRSRPVCLSELVTSIVTTYRSEVHHAGLRFRSGINGDIVVMGDDLRLEQLVSNLLGNAIKYTVEGTISVSLRKLDGEAVLQIRDSGIGISPGILPDIFTLFTQADVPLDRTQSGLGIGLTLIRNLAEMHGGRIDAESPGLGKGSTFTLRLPLYLEAAQEEGASAPTPHAAAARSLNILVVEDNRDAAATMVEILDSWGHHTRSAYDGAAAMDAIHVGIPDVVVMDIGLPGMDGYALMGWVRGQPELSGVVVLALTGYGQEEDRQRTSEAGFHHHLVKPLDFQSLERLLSPL